MYEDKFEIGQRIRSYDFEGRKDCYVEGEIVAIRKECSQEVPFYAYELKVDREVFGGEEDRRPSLKDEPVFAPMATMFDYEGRLVLVESPEPEPKAEGNIISIHYSDTSRKFIIAVMKADKSKLVWLDVEFESLRKAEAYVDHVLEVIPGSVRDERWVFTNRDAYERHQSEGK